MAAVLKVPGRETGSVTGWRGFTGCLPPLSCGPPVGRPDRPCEPIRAFENGNPAAFTEWEPTGQEDRFGSLGAPWEKRAAIGNRFEIQPGSHRRHRFLGPGKS